MPVVRFQSGAEGSQSFVSEHGGGFAITLTLSQPSSVPVTVVVRPFPSGVDAADMDLSDHTVTFAPGETSAIYHAQIYDDSIDEPDENVTFEIVSATNATIDLSSTDAYRIIGRILDDDVPAGPTVRFISGAQGSQSFVSEGAGYFAITLTLSQPSSVPVTVIVRPFPGDVDSADMDLSDHSITFAPGETSATYHAQIFDDSIDEPDENVFFQLVSVTNATIDLSSTDAYRILGRIVDDDVPAGPTVRFLAGAQGSQSFVSEGAGGFAITLTLSQPSSVPVTLVVRPFASSVDEHDMDLSDVTLTFAPGETSATYHARINDDSVDEPDENVVFQIVSATNATIDVSSLDAYRIIARILDNDAPAMTGTDGADTLIGGAENDSIDGLGGADRISGGDGDDLLAGGRGDDVLIGGNGHDHLLGGAGSDLFSGRASELDGDVIGDFAVGDRIAIVDADPATFAFTFSAGTLSFGGTHLSLPGVYAGAHFLVRAGAQGGVELSIEPQFGGAALASTGFGANPGAGGWSSNDHYPRQLGDVNGDGRADIVGFGEAGTYVSLATPSGGFANPFLATTAFGAADGAGGWASNDRYPREAADVNGDGRADIVGFGEAGTYVALGLANGAFAAPVMASTGFGAAAGAGGWSSDDLYPRQMADVNGDGRADIVGFGISGVYVSLASASGGFAPATLAIAAFGSDGSAGGWTSQNVVPRCLADVNGDGRADIVGFGFDGVFVALATGDGSFAAPALALASFGPAAASGGWSSNELYPRLVGDVNGDGHADIVGFGQDGVFIALGRGDGTFGPVMPDVGFFGAAPDAGGWGSDNIFPRALADVNHDGALDIVAFAGGGTYVALSNGDIWM